MRRESRFDRAAAWYIRRTGSRLMEWTLVFLGLLILVVMVPAYPLMNIFVFDVTASQVLRAVGWLEVAMGLALAWAVGALMSESWPLRRWVGGDHGRESGMAAYAWIIEGVPRTIFRAGVVFTVATLAWCVGASQLYGLGPAATTGLMIGGTVAVVGSAIFLFLVFEQALRTVLLEISDRWDASGVSARGVSLQAKVMWFVPVVVLYTAMFTGSLRTDRFGKEVEVAMWAACTLGFTVTFGWVMASLLRRSVLERAGQLSQALERVADGQYRQRLIATYGDELDEIVHGFNEMTERLAAHDADLRESRARIVTASDESRRRVERDLHDGAQQYLVLMELKLGLARRAIEADPAKAADILDEARGDLDHALTELRDLAHGLYPAVLESDGLAAALRAAGERSPLPVSVQANGVGRASSEVEAAVYFCCLEAMQNAAKHAGEGASIAVTLGNSGGRLRFTVADDGRGYDTDALGTSHGLQNMADRIGALGGELSIKSSPGKGTVVSGSTPVETR